MSFLNIDLVNQFHVIALSLCPLKNRGVLIFSGVCKETSGMKCVNNESNLKCKFLLHFLFFPSNISEDR